MKVLIGFLFFFCIFEARADSSNETTPAAAGTFADLTREIPDTEFISGYLALSSSQRLGLQKYYLSPFFGAQATLGLKNSITLDGQSLLRPELSDWLKSSENLALPEKRFDFLGGDRIYFVTFKLSECRSKKTSEKTSETKNPLKLYLAGILIQSAHGASGGGEPTWKKSWYQEVFDWIKTELCPSKFHFVQLEFCDRFAEVSPDSTKTIQNDSSDQSGSSQLPKVNDSPQKTSTEVASQIQSESLNSSCNRELEVFAGFKEDKPSSSQVKTKKMPVTLALFRGDAREFSRTFDFRKWETRLFEYFESNNKKSQNFVSKLPLNPTQFERQKALFVFLAAQPILPVDSPMNICHLNQKFLERMRYSPDNKSLAFCSETRTNLNAALKNSPQTQAVKLFLKRSSAQGQLTPVSRANHENLASHFEKIFGDLLFSTSQDLSKPDAELFNKVQLALEQNLASELLGEIWPYWKSTLNSQTKGTSSQVDLEALIASKVVELVDRGERSLLLREADNLKTLIELCNDLDRNLANFKSRFTEKNIPKFFGPALSGNNALMAFAKKTQDELRRRGF